MARRPAAVLLGTLLAVGALAPACVYLNFNLTAPTRPPAATVHGGRGRQIALAIPFEDRRPDPVRCGIQKNGLAMRTADVFCTEPATRWVPELLAFQLSRAGFAVVPVSRASPEALRIDGTLQQLFVEPDVGGFGMSIEADVDVELRATSTTGLIAVRGFYAKSTVSAVMSDREEFQQALDAAAEAVATQMASAIVSLIERYPGLGVPADARLAAEARP